MGVAFEPLRRLAPLLGDRVRSAVLREDVRYIGDADVAEGDDDQGEWLTCIASARQVASAADELVALVTDHAVVFAERYASVDALLDAYSDGDPEEWGLRRAGLLAAANRFTDAEAALVAYPAVLSREDERFVRQLRRWMASGGDLGLIPQDASPQPRALEMPSWREVRRQLARRQAAVEAVKRSGAGRDRDVLRSMLDAELARRGLTESPLWKEQTLDHLYDQPSAGDTLRSLKAFGRLGLGLARALCGELPDSSAPPWLRPPVRASDRIVAQREPGRTEPTHVAAVVDPAARAWLDDAYAAIARIIEHAPAHVDAWLDWDDAKRSRLGVHIGERRVAAVDDRDVSRYAAAMDAAATRDELPCVKARLTPRAAPEGYLLELEAPETQPPPPAG